MKALRDLVKDPEIVDKISTCFSDLRADYELDLETSKASVEALIQQHVESRSHLQMLSAVAQVSSGVVQGLRGTGKTHLMLLARHKINGDMVSKKALCIYVNLKRLSLPSGASEDVFNRIFAVHVYECTVRQLQLELSSRSPKGLLAQLRSLSDSDRRKFLGDLAKAISQFSDAANNWLAGSTTLSNVGDYTSIISEVRKTSSQEIAKLGISLGVEGIAVSAGADSGQDSTSESGMESSQKPLTFFDPARLHAALKRLVSTLGLKSLTIFVDEWEKIYQPSEWQRWAAAHINKLVDTPIYCWIAYVPYRGSLQPLSIGADLQHVINLDADLVIENSIADRQACLEYFKDFVAKRLKAQFPDGSVKPETLLNNTKKLELLVLGSMGNPRDFGTILLAAWQNYCAYRLGQLKQGKPFQYISEQHIREAVQADGRKKKENINSDGLALKAWNRVLDFLASKGSSHFSVLENKNQVEAISAPMFSELMYQRLLSIRKTGVEQKDRSGGDKLMIFAASFSATIEMHAKIIQFVKDNRTLGNRVRRYILDVYAIVREIGIQEGSVHPCKACQAPIDPNKMKAAWSANNCPFCGGAIH